MQRQGGGACYTAEGVIVEGTCRAPIPLKGGAMVPGCVEGQCGLPVISGGGCGCNKSLFGGRRRKSRKATRKSRKSRKTTTRRRRNTRRNH